MEHKRGPCAASGSEPQPELLTGSNHGRNPESDSGVRPEFRPEIHPELDPESQMAFKRLITRKHSVQISSLTMFRLGFGLGNRVGYRVALRAALDVIPGAAIGSRISVELDAAL